MKTIWKILRTLIPWRNNPYVGLIILTAFTCHAQQHKGASTVRVKTQAVSLLPVRTKSVLVKDIIPGPPYATPQTALVKRAKSGSDYDVFRYEFFADFIPNSCAILVSTDNIRWEAYEWRDCQPGAWNPGDVVKTTLPPSLYVRACGSLSGAWFDFPVRLRR